LSCRTVDRIAPVGREVLFEEPDLMGTFPMNIIAVPASRLALVSDGGIRDNALRVVNLDQLASGGAPVTSYLAFPRPTALYYGLVWIAPNRALASGGGDAMVYAFDIDPMTGQSTRVATRDIALGMSGDQPWYSGAMAVSGDGKRLIVAPSQYAKEFQVISLDDADYGTRVGSISTGGASAIFDVRIDPFDPMGNTFYATDQSGSNLIEIEIGQNAPTRTLPLAKSPAQLVFLDETYAAVAEAHGDSIALVNRATMKVDARIPIFDTDAPRGASPSALAYDATNKRLFAVFAGINAVGVYDVGMGAPPTITQAGSISTAWWPTGVIVDNDGSLVIINGKGHGAGPDPSELGWSDGNITDLMRGSVQHVPVSELANLAAHTMVVEKGRHLDKLAGAPAITCPAGTTDFPIPATNTEGPSKVIKHVIVVIRENKTYDSVLGDRTDLGDGDPKLIMAPDVATQSAVWQNARAIAETFTNFDNFYTDAEQSVQGHVWTAFGRTNDYVERVWLSTWGRNSRPPTEPTTSKQSAPEEGSIFHWLGNNGIDYDNMGEIVGNAPKGLDGKYPGLVYSGELPDTEKSCYMLGRIRLRCDLKPFTYAVQPNDHTSGGSAGAPAPEVMIAVNDEATGMLIDGLSHSPNWKNTLVIITEDDPQNGADHVDLHRTVMWMVSPWVRRKYVSHGHYDMSSVYKLVAHIFGIPYNNEYIRSALLPSDAFTSTPDYTPFTYLPRTIAAPCNADGNVLVRPRSGRTNAWVKGHCPLRGSRGAEPLVGFGVKPWSTQNCFFDIPQHDRIVHETLTTLHVIQCRGWMAHPKAQSPYRKRTPANGSAPRHHNVVHQWLARALDPRRDRLRVRYDKRSTRTAIPTMCRCKIVSPQRETRPGRPNRPRLR
jgi:hypothetical protein